MSNRRCSNLYPETGLGTGAFGERIRSKINPQ